MIMSKYYAYVSLPMHTIILNDDKKGFRVTLEAKENLQKSKSGIDVYSVETSGEIIWISQNEFINNDFKEIPVKGE